MSPTRRAILAGPLPAVVGLSGCAGEFDPDEREPAGETGTKTDPTVHTVRNLDDGPVVTALGDRDGRRVGRTLIRDATTVESLAFGAGVPDGDAESARAFLAETDFDEETIYVTERRIESCERYRLRSISWEPGRIELKSCTELRPTDEYCRADARERLGLFVRIPAVLEESISSFGSRGGPCHSTATDWETVDETGNANETTTERADEATTEGEDERATAEPTEDDE